ncbi:TIGR03936 family radical SAM-associated protein [Thermosediminibacter litoriperuensis]|uniref:Radical SAM-linked protein n=1 Tax=Thermosediminibacter litoriperuensis TaxID=291989 RepID=A0A5S5AZ15_9FIRM|nr:TIGR03936 family radical SAM-associated protein [Thermosediminibacter litoriperuensis]TYP57604.1 radical SAM-linked protein [Thermosediminibacter litoriperuensis]
MRVRMKIRKGEEVKFISQLDLMRALERAIRRAELPVKFTEGFNPRPRISFTPALPVGMTSDAEYMDVEFAGELPLDRILARLNSCLPPGISVLKADTAEGKIPLSSVNRAIYTVVVDAGGDATPELLDKAIAELLARPEITVTKTSKGKVKNINISPLIYSIKITRVEGSRAELRMELAAGQEGNVTPPVVIKALLEYIPTITVCRMNRDELFLVREGKRNDPI